MEVCLAIKETIEGLPRTAYENEKFAQNKRNPQQYRNKDDVCLIRKDPWEVFTANSGANMKFSPKIAILNRQYKK